MILTVSGSLLKRGWKKGRRMRFVLPPHMLNYECGYTAGQFPKFGDEVYKIANPTSEVAKFMLPTAETALVNLHRDEILTLDELPRKYISVLSP